ncbi:hypothetical protein [uncultured Hydrogenophaga sp.]|uniref:hypothetical protein n=1 Tax=uncultured Hydrogenophaga sp. TaxID=199683 RepID=UPI00258F91B9|nr:hypothetical protein [uncultured Hydrogenophaga sp.]
MNYSTVFLEYRQEVMADDEEPSRYIQTLEGHVVLDFENHRERVGRFRVFVIDVESAVNDEESVFDIFDSYSETMGYWSLYQDGLEFRPKVVKVLPGGERWRPNMLILDRMEVVPKYRGKGIGLCALNCLQRRYSIGCGIIAMKPFPLQFEGGLPEENAAKEDFIAMGLGAFDRDFKRATAKLRRYYGRLGFVRVPGTEYMVADPFVRMPFIRWDAG